MEADHSLSPAEAARRAMGEITAPIIAITLVLMSVFVPVAFIPGISGELFRQFAVVVTVSMIISAINALTLSPALCGVLLKQQSWAEALSDAADHVAASIWRATAMRRSSSGWCGSPSSALVALAVMIPGDRLAVQDHADRLPAVRGPGRHLRRSRCCPRVRPSIVTDEVTQQVEDMVRADAGRRRRHVGRRLQHAGRSGEVQRRPAGADAEALRRAQGSLALGRSADRQAFQPGPADPPCQRDLLQSAADHRPRHRQRLRVPAAEHRPARPPPTSRR